MILAPIDPDSAAFALFVRLLSEAGLPTDDLVDGGRYYALRQGEVTVAAFGGLVPFGDDALLRSVVVASAGRGQGLGAKVVDGLANLARTYGIRRLWLLTTDASDFFDRHGFARMTREAAPPAIAASRQFSALCPASAVLMCRTLV